MLLMIAIASSAMSLAVLVWLMPVANQSFQEEMAGHYGVPHGTLKKGSNLVFLVLSTLLFCAKSVDSDGHATPRISR